MEHTLVRRSWLQRAQVGFGPSGDESVPRKVDEPSVPLHYLSIGVVAEHVDPLRVVHIRHRRFQEVPHGRVASHLVMRNVPLKAVQELLGHATIEMTMRYAHLSADARRDAVSVLDLPVPDRTPSSDRPANRLTTAPVGSASS